MFNRYISFINKNEIKSMDEMLQYELKIALDSCSLLRDYMTKLKPYDMTSLWEYVFTDVEFQRNMELLSVLSYHRDNTLQAELEFFPSVGDAFAYVYLELLELKRTMNTKLDEDSDIHICCYRHNEMRRLYSEEFLRTRTRVRAESLFDDSMHA